MAEEEGEGTQDPSENLDEVELEGFEFSTPEDEPEGDKGEEGGDGEGETKKDEPEDKVAAQLSDFQARINRLEGDKSDLKKALHEARQERKQEKEPLSKDQIVAIMKEHKDDPEVLFNVIAHVAKESAIGAKKGAIDDVEVKSQKNEFEAYCSKLYGDKWTNDDSDIRQGIKKAKDALRLNDHPFGDYAAIGVQLLMNLPKIQQQAYEKGKAESAKGKAEDAREGAIKDGQLSKGKPPSGPKGDKGKFGLTPQHLDTAKRLGLTTDTQLKTYASMIKNKPTARKEG